MISRMRRSFPALVVLAACGCSKEQAPPPVPAPSSAGPAIGVAAPADPSLVNPAISTRDPELRKKRIEENLALMNDPDPQVRMAALNGLRMAASTDDLVERVVPAMAAMLDGDSELSNRIQAAVILREYGAQAAPAVPALVKRLADPKMREVAMRALENLGKPAREALPALLDLLKSPEWAVRQQAAFTLGKIGKHVPEAVGPITGLLTGDTEPGVRAAAADGLGSMGTLAKPSLPALREAAAKDPAPAVRDHAAIAVRAIEAAR